MSDNTGLDLLRQPFPDHQVGKLAKGSKAQTQCKPEEKKNCVICGGWHHPKMIHLDFVGHAALTDRLLDCDINWHWEPLAYTAEGLPAFDEDGGLWIWLSLCGTKRLGYGNAEKSQYKEIGSRKKEVIGDALRNAAMRGGAALGLWHKGDLHMDNKPDPDQATRAPAKGHILPEKQTKAELQPGTPAWGNAIAAFKRDGHYDAIEKRMAISDANKTAIKEEAANVA